MRPLLLVIGTGRREFREYLLRSIHQQYRIHLFAAAKPVWEMEFLDGHTVIAADDVPAMITMAKDLQSGEPVSGVLCWEEKLVRQAGEVARSLGLPGDPDAIARCGETHLTRQALAAAGVPQPGWARVSTLPDALVEAGRMGYPLKINAMTQVETAEQLTSALDGNNATLLLEEFVTGEQISVDVAVHSGEIFPLCLARKEIADYYVHAEDPLLHDPVLFRLLHDTHRALGFYDGVTHTEIMMAPDGPRVVEVSGRLGGDVIPYLGLKATGVDAGLAAAAVACGRAPHVERDRKLVAAVRFFSGDAPVRFDAKGLPASIDRLAALDNVDVKGRIAFATAVAETAEECRAALDAAEAALRVD